MNAVKLTTEYLQELGEGLGEQSEWESPLVDRLLVVQALRVWGVKRQ